MSGADATYWSRRIRRHTLLAALAAGSTAALAFIIPTDFLPRRLAVATAFSGLGFLGAALLIGPLRVIRGLRSPVSMDLRRDVGIWAAVLSIVHVVIGLQVHFRGRGGPIRYFTPRPEDGAALPVRTDAMGFANYTGLGATLILLTLLMISNDVALRTLGTGRWKAIQRWNYVAFALVAIHGVVFQVMTSRPWPAVALMWLMMAAVVAGQALGYRTRRKD